MRWVGSTLLAIGMGAALHAQGTLTLTAPAAPGGGWDQTARALQRVWARVEPTTSVQVENVAGAAGTIGLARFVTAERGNPDALLVTGLVMVSGVAMTHSPVSLANTTPIARLTGEYEVIVVPRDSPLASLEDLVTAFKANPSTIAWGGGSAGGTDDLLVRLLADVVGVAPNKANYIAFPGGGAALAALLGGQVAAGVSGYSEFAGQIAAGELRVLGISAPARVPGIEAATLREQGIALDLANWRGIVAPPGLTDAEQTALIERLTRVVTSPEWREILNRNGWQDLFVAGPPFRQFLLAEQRRVDAVLQRLRLDSSAASDGWLHLTPWTAPALALTGLALFGAVAVRRSRTEGRWSGSRHAGLLVATLVVHAMLFPTLGFIPASTALFAATTAIFGSRRFLRDATIGLVLAVLLFVLFTAGLGLTLPPDPFTRVLGHAGFR